MIKGKETGHTWDQVTGRGSGIPSAPKDEGDRLGDRLRTGLEVVGKG